MLCIVSHSIFHLSNQYRCDNSYCSESWLRGRKLCNQSFRLLANFLSRNHTLRNTKNSPSFGALRKFSGSRSDLSWTNDTVILFGPRYHGVVRPNTKCTNGQRLFATSCDKQSNVQHDIARYTRWNSKAVSQSVSGTTFMTKVHSNQEFKSEFTL